MKKIAVVLALVVAGALSLAPMAANASPYPGTVATHCGLHMVKRHSHRTKIRPTVVATTSGNARPVGTVTLSVGGKVRARAAYRGPAMHFNLGPFKRGNRTVVLRFAPKPGTVFKGCSASHTIRIY